MHLFKNFISSGDDGARPYESKYSTIPLHCWLAVGGGGVFGDAVGDEMLPPNVTFAWFGSM